MSEEVRLWGGGDFGDVWGNLAFGGALSFFTLKEIWGVREMLGCALGAYRSLKRDLC